MTRILIDRAVVEQALHVATAAGYPVALIATLRASLAQDQLHDQQLRDDAERWRNIRGYVKAMEDEICALRSSLRAALAEPVQEPVAWLFTNLQSGDYDFCYQEDEHAHDREMWHKQPLYTTSGVKPK